jgi:hypothetical protein
MPVVIVVGLVRDAARTFQRDYERLNSELSKVASVYWHVVESDSKDGTVQLLEKISLRNKNFRYSALGNLTKTIPGRLDRIAHCRNEYLEKLSSLELKDADAYLLVADLDGINKLLRAAAIRKAMDYRDYAMLSANQRGPYYDISALRAERWNDHDCWDSYQRLLDNGFDEPTAHQVAVKSKMIRISEQLPPIPVASSFGGAALYRLSYITGARYSSTYDGLTNICEHVSFNSKVRENGGKLAIAPWLINSSYNEHTYSMNPFVEPLRPAIVLARKLAFRVLGKGRAENLYFFLRRISGF